jgi:hypothetical protein
MRARIVLTNWPKRMSEGQSKKGRDPRRRAEGGHEHYIVRWDDNGHEALFFPGPTTHVCTPTVAQRSGDGHDAHD